MPNQAYQDFVIRARDRFTRPMRDMQRQTTAFSRNAQRSLGSVSRSFDRMRNVARFAAGAITTGLIARGIGGLVRAAADVETVTTQFETLTGSIENARNLVGDLQNFAASTPLQFETLADATQRLMAFGVAQEDVLGTLQVLGDAAQGDAQRLDSLTRAFGKVQARGRASMEEINMVIDAGVPIMDALNQELGTTTEQLTEMMRAGEVSADVFEAAFNRMTSDGGQFHRGMERQSQTTAGLFSTLKDNIQLTAASVGQALLPTAQELTQELIRISGNMREWVNANQDLINQRVQDTVTGIANAGRFVGRSWNNGMIPALLAGVAAFKASTVAIGALQAGLVALKAGAGGFSAIMAVLGGPVTAVAAAIAALAAGVVYLRRNWESYENWFANSRVGQWLDRTGDKFDSVAARSMEVAESTGLGAGFRGESSALPVYRSPGITSSQISHSTVDVNLNGLPQGSTVHQSGRAPGVTLSAGYQVGAFGY